MMERSQKISVCNNNIMFLQQRNTIKILQIFYQKIEIKIGSPINI